MGIAITLGKDYAHDMGWIRSRLKRVRSESRESSKSQAIAFAGMATKGIDILWKFPWGPRERTTSWPSAVAPRMIALFGRPARTWIAGT
jgi:hypothetical protein